MKKLLIKLMRYALSYKTNVKKKNIIGSYNNLKINKTAKLNNCKFNINGSSNLICIMDSSSLNNVKFFIKGNNNSVIIHENVKFNKGGEVWIEGENCIAKLGENSTFEDVHIAVTEPNSIIKIGKDCMFANGIDLRTGDSHSIIDNKTSKRINYAKNIIIGDHVWVASHVSILKGVNLPDSSVVATRTVVTKSFETQNILIGGIPAKILKQNVNWLRDKIYD